jgi:RHS repeat-associated protein
LEVDAPVTYNGFGHVTAGLARQEGTVSTELKGGVKNTSTQVSPGTAAKLRYDAFGNIVGGSGTWTGNEAHGGGFGYQTDSTGLQLLGHRWYDPLTGRFISKDPAGSGDNWYAYCDNNPLTAADPSGLAHWVFNGRYLILISDDGKTKKEIARIPAASGVPGSTAQDAWREDYGPIPPGKYSVDPGEIGRHGWNWPGPDYDDDVVAWGKTRAPLKPKPGNRMLGRKGGFFIHGGDYIGSIGCIDVGPNDEYTMGLVRKWGNGKPMEVTVDYGFGPFLPIPGTGKSPVRWRGGSVRQ